MQTHIQNTLQKIQKRTTNRLQEIRKYICQCVNPSIGEIQSLRLTINHPLPEFKDDNKILNIAVTRTTESLKSYIKYKRKMTDERLDEKGLINHTDQQYQFESDFVAAYIHNEYASVISVTKKYNTKNIVSHEMHSTYWYQRGTKNRDILFVVLNICKRSLWWKNKISIRK
eukprot:540897_1